jgi:hypothetical protein
MDRTNDGNARALAAALAQDEANRRSVFEWADLSWFADTPLHGKGRPMSPAVLAAYAPRWLELVGILPLSLHALCGNAGLLAALPIPGLRKMLRLRALWSRRTQLRHWVDKARRMRLRATLGAATAEVLRRDSANALSGPTWIENAPALEAMSDEALEWEGYCLFACDGIWPNSGPVPLARVALPRDGAVPPWLTRHRSAADDSEAIFEYLPLVTSENR